MRSALVQRVTQMTRGGAHVLLGILIGLIMSSALAVAQDDPDGASAPAAQDAAGAKAPAAEAAPTEQAEAPDAAARIAELEQRLAQLQESCPTPAQERERDDIANRLRQMRPASAAALMATLPAELAVDLMRRLDKRSSARILDKMPTAPAAKIIEQMASPADASPTQTGEAT